MVVYLEHSFLKEKKISLSLSFESSIYLNIFVWSLNKCFGLVEVISKIQAITLNLDSFSSFCFVLDYVVLGLEV